MSACPVFFSGVPLLHDFISGYMFRDMKAATYYGPRDLRVEERDCPPVQPGTAIVRIEYCGICGSDAHAYLRGPEHTVMQKRIMGHEYGGVVEAVGEGVTRFRPGDRVTGMGIGGGFAERWIFPEAMLVPIPEGMTTREAALAEPLAVSLRGVKRAAARSEEKIAVIGAGPIGLFAIAILKMRGFGGLIVSEPDPTRRELALKMGAAEALDPGAFEPRIRELTGFGGLDLVFECVGLRATMDVAMGLLGRGGRLLVLAALTEPFPLTIFNFFVKEITIIPSFAYESEFGEAVEMIARHDINPMQLVTREIPLDDIREGFESLAKKELGQIKILVKC